MAASRARVLSDARHHIRRCESRWELDIESHYHLRRQRKTQWRTRHLQPPRRRRHDLFCRNSLREMRICSEHYAIYNVGFNRSQLLAALLGTNELHWPYLEFLAPPQYLTRSLYMLAADHRAPMSIATRWRGSCRAIIRVIAHCTMARGC